MLRNKISNRLDRPCCGNLWFVESDDLEILPPLVQHDIIYHAPRAATISCAIQKLRERRVIQQYCNRQVTHRG